MTERHALVTGGSGYFGSLLVDHLHEQGDHVRVFDLNRPADEAGVDVVVGDIRDEAAVRAACDGVDVVYHNVAQVPLARDREQFESVNVGGMATLLRAASAAGVRKLVVTSSSAVFGIPDRNPVTEETAPKPLEAYGRAKLEAEALCAQATDLDITIIRPRTILGHGRLGIMAAVFEWVAEGAPVWVLGRGDNRYQFVHAADLASACRLAAERPGASVYNIGAGEFGTMRETLQALVDHAGTGSRVRSLPVRPATLAMKMLGTLRLVPLAPYHWLLYGRSLYFDTTRAQQELGWQPTYSNEAMMIESYEWFLAHRRELHEGTRSRHQSPVRQGALRLLKHLP